MKHEKMCLHQFIRPDRYPLVFKEGIGNCWECIPHKDNKYCSAYYPIHVTIIKVEDNKKVEGDKKDE